MAKETNLQFAAAHEIEILQELLDKDTNNAIKRVRNGSPILGEVVLVVEYGGEIAGFLTYRSSAPEIFPLVIFDEYRRLGIGISAVRLLVNMLRNERISELIIDVVEGAERFWEKAFDGFESKHVDGRKYRISILSNEGGT